MKSADCGKMTFIRLMNPSKEFKTTTLARDFTGDNHKLLTFGYVARGGDITKNASHNFTPMIVRKDIVRMKGEISCHTEVIQENDQVEPGVVVGVQEKAIIDV